jgi:predicted Mrr-cat superfamily restriction endonuclease
MKSIIWKVGACDSGKDLVPPMLKDQVMLIGVGDSVGDITNMTKSDVLELKLPANSKLTERAWKRQLQYLVSFCYEAKKGELVVLCLGSVCFSVGVIKSDYFYDATYNHVYSYWNKDKRYDQKEQEWQLPHARSVKWFGLTDQQTLCHFRKGIYGGAQCFCKIRDVGETARTKKILDDYL